MCATTTDNTVAETLRKSQALLDSVNANRALTHSAWGGYGHGSVYGHGYGHGFPGWGGYSGYGHGYAGHGYPGWGYSGYGAHHVPAVTTKVGCETTTQATLRKSQELLNSLAHTGVGYGHGSGYYGHGYGGYGYGHAGYGSGYYGHGYGGYGGLYGSTFGHSSYVPAVSGCTVVKTD